MDMASYLIIGHDQKPYGPVTEATLRQWIAGGRVNARTQAQLEGTDAWKPLSDFPEFAEALSPAIVTGRTSRMAVTSLVLGILTYLSCGTLGLITLPLGLGFGIAALVSINKNRAELKGHGLALSGVILNGLALLVIPVFAAMLLPAFAAARQRAMEINCVNNEKRLAMAVHLYAGSHANHFPAGTNWCDALQNYVPNRKVFQCPALPANGRCGYAFNEKLDGLDVDKVNPQTVMIFESDPGWNLAGGPEWMKSRHRRRGKQETVVALADGSVQTLSSSQLDTLRWDP